jgi:hypothetical protein
MELTKETSPANDVYHGHITVGVIPVPLCESRISYRGTLVYASPDNTEPVWIGGDGVTAGSGPKGGMPLRPGESLHFPTDDPSKIHLVSLADGQDVAFIGV